MVITGALTHLRKDQVTCQQGWKGKAPSHMPVDPWNPPKRSPDCFSQSPCKVQTQQSAPPHTHGQTFAVTCDTGNPGAPKQKTKR